MLYLNTYRCKQFVDVTTHLDNSLLFRFIVDVVCVYFGFQLPGKKILNVSRENIFLKSEQMTVKGTQITILACHC